MYLKSYTFWKCISSFSINREEGKANAKNPSDFNQTGKKAFIIYQSLEYGNKARCLARLIATVNSR